MISRRSSAVVAGWMEKDEFARLVDVMILFIRRDEVVRLNV